MTGNTLKTGTVLVAVRRYAQKNGAGLVGSAVLHGFFLLLVLLVMSQRVTHYASETPARILPVDIVHLGDQTQSPPAPVRAPIPQQRAFRPLVRETTSPNPPEGTAPRKERDIPLENFAAKLNALAHLKQTSANLPVLDNSQDSDQDTTSDGAVGDEATYAVKDFIRAQVQRRWSVDFSLPRARNMSVLIHLQMKKNGTVVFAEIVDQHRYKTDASWRELALSARNAVLLSSPFALPPGHYRDVMDMTLRFDPKDTLH